MMRAMRTRPALIPRSFVMISALASMTAGCGSDPAPTFTGDWEITARTLQADCVGETVEAPIQAGDQFFQLEETEDNTIIWRRCSAPMQCSSERGLFVEDIEG